MSPLLRFPPYNRSEVTTTRISIPKNYFPSIRRKKKVKTMKEVDFALQLVEDGFSYQDALEAILEQDVDKAAKKMAKKAAPDDSEKQAELEAKFRTKMKKMKETGKKKKR